MVRKTSYFSKVIACLEQFGSTALGLGCRVRERLSVYMDNEKAICAPGQDFHAIGQGGPIVGGDQNFRDQTKNY